MKKYITLLSFVAVFFVGLQQTQAQDDVSQDPQATAKMQTHAIHEITPLTGEQQSGTFYILLDFQQNLKGLTGKTSLNVEQAKTALIERTNAKLKAILTPEQYNTHLELLEKFSK